MDSERISLSLELELDQGHLSGRATDGDGTARSFSGWLGLIGAIDALVEADATSTHRETVHADR